MKNSASASWIAGVALALMVALPSSASASAITIFGTGLNATGTPLALGASDSHYLVEETSTQAVVLNPPNGSYAANDGLSEWVWQNANGQPTSVTRTFETTFDLSGFNFATASISGLWGADNTGLSILLNGNDTGITLPGSPTTNFTTLHAFTINTPAFFVPGVNTLEFVIQDVGAVAGFRAQLSGTADPIGTPAVPEPASFGLLLSGLSALAATRRRQRRS